MTPSSYDKTKTYRRAALVADFRAQHTNPFYVLHRDGQVLAFTINRWQNPLAPAEILVGPGAARERLAESFITNRPVVPVFIKDNERAKDWQYAGTFRLKSAIDTFSEKEKRVNPPDIPDIYKILFLEEVAA